MNKAIVACSLTIISLVYTSCTHLYIYSYGVRNPKTETSSSIISYLQSKQLNTKDSYALRDSIALRVFHENGISMPEIQFFDKNGYLMIYRDEKRCNDQNDSLISFLDPKNIVKIDSSNNIHDYINQLRTLEGNVVSGDEFKNSDYYLIMYWAKWLGKVNSIKMRDWEKTISKKDNLKLKTIKVTTDYMDFWHVPKNEMVKVYSFRTKITDKKKEREQENADGKK